MTGKRIRNITNGQVVISVDEEDKITTDEDLPEAVEASISTMRANPNKTESYLESTVLLVRHQNREVFNDPFSNRGQTRPVQRPASH